MPGNFKKEDLRIAKSQNSLLNALGKLLGRKTFRQLTVNDLCAESQLSRTAFYSHFQDKYDLLKFYLHKLKTELLSEGYGFGMLGQKINDYIAAHTKLIRNILDDTDNETIDIIYGFILKLINIPMEKDSNDKPNQRYTAVSNFCAGGIFKCLLWQVKHGFPPEQPMMSRDFYYILKNMLLQKEKER